MQAIFIERSSAQFPPRISHPQRPHLVPEKEERNETVYLVDHDRATRHELCGLLTAMKVKVVGFSAANEYLQHVRSDSAGCLVVDTQLPGMNGLELQRRLLGEAHPPIVFISGDHDIRSTVSAMKAGAIEFLTKPVDLSALLSAIKQALAQDRRTRQKRAELTELQQRLSSLTPREREVFPLVVSGLLNKQAASVLNISEVTLQIHRSQVMKKMKADSFADLVRMAVKLRIPYWRQTA
jgi:FixJ family two-component response regulator